MFYGLGLLFLLTQLVMVGVGIVLLARLARRSRQADRLWLLAVAARKEMTPPVSQGIPPSTPADVAWLHTLLDHVESGASFSRALDSQPGVIPTDAELLARVGERVGRLPESLAESAQRLVRPHPLWAGASNPGMALFSLVVVPITAALIVGFLSHFIAPKMKKIFDDFGGKLPGATRSFLGFAEGLAELVAPMVIALAVIGLLVGIKWVVRRIRGQPRPRGRRSGREAPMVPTLCRALALTAEAGRPWEEGLTPLAENHPGADVRSRFAALRESVRAGHPLWSTGADAGLFSRQDAELLTVAERAGNLPWALRFLAEREETRRLHRLAVWLEWLQPALVVLLGLMTLWIAAAFFLPLVSLIHGQS